MTVSTMKHNIKLLILQLLAPKFERPVFILSAPRSGSSYFYEIIRRMAGVWSFDKENDPLWWKFFPYSRLSVPSDYIKPGECTQKKINGFRAELLLENWRNRRELRLQDEINHFLLRQPVRYMEKTIANCFHLDVLDKIFPDALYIHLVRDGRACVSSMMEGWNSGLFMKRFLPFPTEATISHWCYPIPPDWEQVVDKSLAEICAWSWIEHNRYILEKRDRELTFHRRCIALTYEDILTEPMAVVTQVADFAGLTNTLECTNYLNQNSSSWTTISQPKADKWKEKNPAAINQVMPMIVPMMQKLGYKF